MSNFIVAANGQLFGFNNFQHEINSYGTLIIHNDKGEYGRFTAPYGIFGSKDKVEISQVNIVIEGDNENT